MTPTEMDVMPLDESSHVEDEKAVTSPVQTDDQAIESTADFQNKDIQPKENDEDRNWSAVHTRLRDQQREIRELKSHQELAKKKSSSDEESMEFEEDDLVSFKQLRPYMKKYAEETVASHLQQKEFETRREKVQERLPDYDQVMTKDNIRQFEEKHPEISNMLMQQIQNPRPNEDPYLLAYTLLKKETVQPVQQKNNLQTQKMQQNLDKPVSGNALGRSQGIAHAQAFAQASKEDLLREMDEARAQR